MKKIFIAFFLGGSALVSAAQFSFGDSLPVRISYFQTFKRGNVHELNWAVTCFLNFANFEIQKSGNGSEYNTIYTFQANELRCRQPFSFPDSAGAKRTFYRIRVGDIDGRFYSSKTVVAYEETEGFNVTGIYPSVINENALVSISSSSSGKINLAIINPGGNIIQKSNLTLQKGENNIPLRFAGLPKGVYIISVLNEKNQLQSIRAVKN